MTLSNISSMLSVVVAHLRIEVHFFRYHWEIKCSESLVNLVKCFGLLKDLCIVRCI